MSNHSTRRGKQKTIEAFGPSRSDASRCCIRVSLVVLSGAEPGLVPPDASHVAGQQRRGRGAERDEEPAGQTGVHHEAGVQPVRPADRAEGAGGSGSLRLRSLAPLLLSFRCRTCRMSHNPSLLASTSSIFSHPSYVCRFPNYSMMPTANSDATISSEIIEKDSLKI